MTGFNGFRYNYLAPRLELEERDTRATEIWLRLGGGLNQAVPHLLIGDNRQINVDDWLRLLAGRDQRPLVIVECLAYLQGLGVLGYRRGLLRRGL